jgi:uncharacterized protein YheU (UPF0270 family)
VRFTSHQAFGSTWLMAQFESGVLAFALRGSSRATAIVYRCEMHDEHDRTGEPEQPRRPEAPPVRLLPTDIEPDTLRAVIESFVLREGTDYGLHETSLEDKVEQVLRQLRRGEAHITFDPATESVNIVTTGVIGGSGRP